MAKMNKITILDFFKLMFNTELNYLDNPHNKNKFVIKSVQKWSQKTNYLFNNIGSSSFQFTRLTGKKENKLFFKIKGG